MIAYGENEIIIMMLIFHIVQLLIYQVKIIVLYYCYVLYQLFDFLKAKDIK